MREQEFARLARRRPALEARARVLQALRAWFASEGFLEVETPARVRAPGQELHLDAIAAGAEPGLDRHPRWLITSPEYAMKRLAGAGYERIVQFGKCWRAGEIGPHHQPEFTMIEWYRAHAPLSAIANDCETLVRLAAQALGRTLPPAFDPPFARVGMSELVREAANVTIAGDETVEELRKAVLQAGVDPRQASRWDDVFFQLWLDKVDPLLAQRPPTFVFDWPAPLAALARRKPGAPHLAERFELYAQGLELANAYGELTDPVEQRRRFEEENRDRGALSKIQHPIDEDLITALARMPPTAGVALGFDRLMMLVLGTQEIRDVLAFAADEV